MGYFALKMTILKQICVCLPLDIIWWSIMFSCAKFQNDPFIRSIDSNKNVKRTFLSSEPLPDDFSKKNFHGDMVNNGICLCVEFHGRRATSLWGVESQRNDMSGCIRASLAPLNYSPMPNVHTSRAIMQALSFFCK